MADFNRFFAGLCSLTVTSPLTEEVREGDVYENKIVHPPFASPINKMEELH
jgi:hypothetical protein